MTRPLMAHLVLGYPSLSKSVEVAETYVKAGVSILELQIPFSHPTADGPVITHACQKATAQGVRVQDCLDAIAALRAQWPDQEIMVMSYLNRIYTYGLERLMVALRGCGVRHLIVPDLPVDSALAHDHFSEEAGVRLVPVLAANAAEERIDQLCAAGFDFFYFMSDFKITGSDFSLNPRLEQLIERVRERNPHARTGIGFGISNPAQVRLATGIADVAIVGSALISAFEKGELEGRLGALLHAN